MNAQMTKKLKDSIELSLCPVCASQFYQSNQYTIRRSNPFQMKKEVRTYCGFRYGWDFQIMQKQNTLKKEVIVSG